MIRLLFLDKILGFCWRGVVGLVMGEYELRREIFLLMGGDFKRKVGFLVGVGV